MKDNDKELLPVVDCDGRSIGTATRGECHGGSMLLHPVVHLHVFDRDGRLYLQKRPEWKDIQPGKWDTAVGGHVDLGETIDEALRREAREELGLEDFKPLFLSRYVFESDRERELVHIFTEVVDTTPTPTEELDCGRFWSIVELQKALGGDVFTPNFEQEYVKYILPVKVVG